MKRIIAAIIALAALILTACSSSPVGKYQAISADLGDYILKDDELSGSTLEIEDGGKAVFSYYDSDRGEPVLTQAEWKEADGKLTFTVDGDDYTAKLDDDRLSIFGKVDGLDINLVFEAVK